MAHHRVGTGSLTVMSLIGDEVRVRPHRHRAQATAVEKVRAAAGAAVAAGALIGTASQVAPALAYAAPLLPGGGERGATEAEPAPPAAEEIAQPAEQQVEVEPAAEPAPPAEVQAAEIAAPAPAPAPFGLRDLPPEVAGPLTHAEQTLKQLTQQFAPAPVVRPVAGTVSSNYGSRWGAMHYGIDFADTLGAPIKSVADGTVIEAGPASGFGLWVRVLHDDGTTGVYGHVNDIYVAEGQRVQAGEVIATVGNRGQSTGPHLHLEIWDQGGNKIDPTTWMASKGVPLEWGPSH